MSNVISSDLIQFYRLSCWILRRQLFFLLSCTNWWKRMCWNMFLFKCIVSSCLWMQFDNRFVQVYYLYTFSNLIVIINLEVREFSLKLVLKCLFIQTSDGLQRSRTTNGKLALSICLIIKKNNWVCLNRSEIYIV